MWAGIRDALQPGGVFAGQLFGIRDSWADTARMSFHDPEQVAKLLEGLEVLRLDETEWDGDALSGAKRSARFTTFWFAGLGLRPLL